jgi:hypothetical protein
MIITSEPKNDIYRRLLDLAFDLCDEFILVVRKEQSLELNENAKSVLEKLNDHLKEIKEQTEWAGTILYEHTAYVYHYNTSPKAGEIIKEVSNSLYAWIHPDLPEDLSFYKNGKPWLVNTAHDKQSFIFSEDKSEINRVASIKGLEIKL